jgi:hypothetical protein
MSSEFSQSSDFGIPQWRSQGLANGQLPNEFGGLPIVIFISNFLPIEIFLFQKCLFIC